MLFGYLIDTKITYKLLQQKCIFKRRSNETYDIHKIWVFLQYSYGKYVILPVIYIIWRMSIMYKIKLKNTLKAILLYRPYARS